MAVTAADVLREVKEFRAEVSSTYVRGDVHAKDHDTIRDALRTLTDAAVKQEDERKVNRRWRVGVTVGASATVLAGLLGSVVALHA